MIVNIFRLKTYLLIPIVISVTALVLISVFSFKRLSGNYNIQCQAFVSYRVTQTVLGYDAEIAIRVMNNGSGQFSIEGKLNKDNETWTLNRDVHFKYDKLTDNSILMKDFIIERYGRDNAPEYLFRNTFLSSDETLGRVVTISKMMNGYLIGNRQTPEFFCVSTKN